MHCGFSQLLPWQTYDLPLKIIAFAQDLTSPNRPIPTFLHFSDTCTIEGINPTEVLVRIMEHVEEVVDYLEGLNLAEPGPKLLPVFSSWTSNFLASGRYLAFLARTPADEYPDVNEPFKLAHRRIVELAAIYLTLR